MWPALGILGPAREVCTIFDPPLEAANPKAPDPFPSTSIACSKFHSVSIIKKFNNENRKCHMESFTNLKPGQFGKAPFGSEAVKSFSQTCTMSPMSPRLSPPDLFLLACWPSWPSSQACALPCTTFDLATWPWLTRFTRYSAAIMSSQESDLHAYHLRRFSIVKCAFPGNGDCTLQCPLDTAPECAEPHSTNTRKHLLKA